AGAAAAGVLGVLLPVAARLPPSGGAAPPAAQPRAEDGTDPAGPAWHRRAGSRGADDRDRLSTLARATAPGRADAAGGERSSPSPRSGGRNRGAREGI